MRSSPLTSADVVRLGKLLGMLGSDQIGERAAAALKADALIRQRGTSWSELVAGLTAASNPAALKPRRPHSLEVHQVEARACLSSPLSWSDRELDFLRNMVARRKPPTDAQAEWLERLAAAAYEFERAA